MVIWQKSMFISSSAKNVSENYESLTSLAVYGLVDTPLPDLFKSISIVEPRAYPVFKALLDAYPPFHFTALIFVYANGDKNENDQY